MRRRALVVELRVLCGRTETSEVVVNVAIDQQLAGERIYRPFADEVVQNATPRLIQMELLCVSISFHEVMRTSRPLLQVVDRQRGETVCILLLVLAFESGFGIHCQDNTAVNVHVRIRERLLAHDHCRLHPFRAFNYTQFFYF